MKIDHYSDPLNTGTTYTHGSTADRFGGAYRNGQVQLHYWRTTVGGPMDGRQKLVSLPKIKCATYRKAQRKLRQWLKGYSV